MTILRDGEQAVNMNGAIREKTAEHDSNEGFSTREGGQAVSNTNVNDD